MTAKNAEKAGPLSGIRVLDIGVLAAGPFAATILGDFGAEVIKVEPPGKGEPLRKVTNSYKDTTLGWFNLSRNKKSITLDLKTTEGQNIFKELAGRSDVVIENFRPGVLEKMGLGYEVLQSVNSRIILARVSGFGQTGPYSQRGGYDRIGAAFGGLTFVTGYPEYPPVRPGFALVDYMTGMWAAIGVLIAIHHRDVCGGSGQEIDLALYESAFRVSEDTVSSYHKLGKIRERAGNEHPVTAPGNNYITKDGKCLLLTVANDNNFQQLVNAMNRPDLLKNPKFMSQRSRTENRREIDGIVSEWIKSKSFEEAFKALEDNRVPVGPVYSIEDIMKDPHYEARRNIIEVLDEEIGSVKMQGVIPKLSLTPGKVLWGGQKLGQSNQEVYGGLLGYSQELISSLRSKGVI